MTILRQPSFLNLPDKMYQKSAVAAHPEPQLVMLNQKLLLNFPELAQLSSEQYPAFFAGQMSEPWTLATAYAGHQFGHFNPTLGDGRAHLLGELAAADGSRFELQLKGSGQTPYSRRGDGKCGLGPALREFLVSRYMSELGIPTCESLAVVLTGEMIQRQELTKGAIISRTAQSHLRVGSLQYAAMLGPTYVAAVLQATANHLEISEDNPLKRASLVLDRVLRDQAELVASWLAVGFIHGVMNTDNCSMLSLTIDYGPCAFMNQFRQAAGSIAQSIITVDMLTITRDVSPCGTVLDWRSLCWCCAPRMPSCKLPSRPLKRA